MTFVLIVSLPQMIAFSALDGESIFLIRDYVNELLVYVAHRHHYYLYYLTSFVAGWQRNVDAYSSRNTLPLV